MSSTTPSGAATTSTPSLNRRRAVQGIVTTPSHNGVDDDKSSGSNTLDMTAPNLVSSSSSSSSPSVQELKMLDGQLKQGSATVKALLRQHSQQSASTPGLAAPSSVQQQQSHMRGQQHVRFQGTPPPPPPSDLALTSSAFLENVEETRPPFGVDPAKNGAWNPSAAITPEDTDHFLRPPTTASSFTAIDHEKTVRMSNVKKYWHGHNNDDDDDDNDSTSQQGKKRIHRDTHQQTCWKLTLRMILIDATLVAVFAVYLLIISLNEIHDVYYRPLFDRAQRTDEQLYEEFTYYERTCTAADLSTQNLTDMVVRDTASLSATLDQFMTHGGVVIPQLLTPDAVQELRAYLVHRNAHIPRAEQYPVSQGKNRISFGLDATEDPAVTKAVRQVAHHPRFTSLLKALLGDDDPASAEITAITAYVGSPYQAWHADTKADGNALKYARTYSHSYSLFMPLQDTTGAMGATDVCPGTQYCANDISDLCEHYKLGLHQASPEGVFRAGDAALLNQHVWHRGSAHTDPEALERIVFIMSFLARPQLGTHDARQLSRGTYFHQKWNMWGHTLLDLMDPLLSMRQPFSILRCLSLWKPASRHWGYDLVTSVFMRFSNLQLEDADLEDRFLPRLRQLHFPTWLQGDLLSDDYNMKSRWQHFIQTTLQKTRTSVGVFTLAIHLGYVVMLLLWHWIRRRKGQTSVRPPLIRLFLTHGLLSLLAMHLMHDLRASTWAKNIDAGHTLMRPFPPADTMKPERDDKSLEGPTTLPVRADVLLGTRYDAKFLGSYDRWLDFHPGNVAFRQAAARFGRFYSTYHTLWGSRVLDDWTGMVMEDVVDQGGRFLIQDYRTGDWRVMSDNQAIRQVALEEILVSGNELFASLMKELRWMIASYRFGLLRGTALANISLSYLHKIEQNLVEAATDPSALHLPHQALNVDPDRTQPRRAPTGFLKPTVLSKVDLSAVKQPIRFRSSFPFNQRDYFPAGSSVWAMVEDAWFRGILLWSSLDEAMAEVAFEDGTVTTSIPLENIYKYEPVTEGVRVEGCYADDLNDCYGGQVLHVYPDGHVAIAFDDGDVEPRFTPDRYYIPPYYYAVAN